jgi:hypothetical protein
MWKEMWKEIPIGGGAVFVAMIASCGVGGFGGALLYERAMHMRQFSEERDLIAPVLSSDPAFVGVKIHEYSGGGVYLVGTVPSADDLGRLRVKLIHVLGEPKTQFLLKNVSAESRPLVAKP